MAAITGESDAIVLVKEHTILGEHITEEVVCLVRDVQWSYESETVQEPKQTDALPKRSGNATLIANDMTIIIDVFLPYQARTQWASKDIPGEDRQ